MQAALTYLSHEGELGKKRRRAAAMNGVHQRILATAMWIVEEQFKLATQPPIQDLSDVRFRTIAFMNAYRYVYDPVEMNCNTRVSRRGNTSVVSGAGTQNEVHWERMVATRVWRSRVRWTIIRNSWLSILNFDEMPHGITWAHTPEARLAYRYLTIAEGKLQLRRRIVAGVDRYAMRHEIRRRLQLPSGLFELARQACLLGANGMTDKWLSFVLKNRSTLERIRAQTPNLLAPTAELLYRNRTFVRDGDPVMILKMFLTIRGVPDQCYQLLVKHGVRPFREILRYGAADKPMESLIAGLMMCRDDHHASLPTPKMLLTTAEVYVMGMDMIALTQTVKDLPLRFFREARAQFRAARTEAEIARVRNEYIAVFDWVQTGHGLVVVTRSRSWKRWVEMAREDEDQKAVELDNESLDIDWPDFEIEGYRVTPLKDLLSVYRESVDMRHCLWNSYEDDFRDGTMAAMHVSNLETGVVATVGVRFEQGKWLLMDVRGECNQPMDRGWRAVGFKIRRIFNEAGV